MGSAIVACAALAFASGPAAAVGLGAVTQQSALGQSLRVAIPLILGAGEELPAECYKLVSAERDADGVPQVVFGRVGLERGSSGARLVVSSARPVNDPVVRLTIQAGCDNEVRREYTLFMDPPAIEPPLVAADSETRNEVPVPPPTPAAAREPARGTATSAPRARTPATGAGTQAGRKAASAKPRAGGRIAPKRAPRVAAGQPRLTVSSAPPPPSDGSAIAATDAPQAQSQQELANALEAETIVLQRRIVELTAMVDRMQQEVQANERAQRAAEEAAKASPWASTLQWWADNWALLAAIIGLPLLIAGGLLWKRRQDATREHGWPATGRATTRTLTRPHPQRAPALRNPPAGVPRPDAEIAPPAAAPAPAAAPTRDGANALAVSELSQVTEEARVYVALGHPDRAIEVLDEHIRELAKSLPAAWLMLLDLYHANGRRQEFRRLAEEFHLHFNVQTPLWESFAPSEPGDVGLDTFPHIVKQVVGLWGRPECHDYLERLLYENREGRRIGFPLTAYGDILLLLQIIDTPPVVDIDSDLAADGKLGNAPPVAATSRAPARSRVPATTEQSRTRKPVPPEPASTVRPPQHPLKFELDLDAEARKAAKKPPS